MKLHVNQAKILAAQDKVREGAAQLIQGPMWFIEQVLLKHEQAVLEVCKELMDERDALRTAVIDLIDCWDCEQMLSDHVINQGRSALGEDEK